MTRKKRSVIAHTFDLAGESVQGQPRLCREFKVCYGYVRPYLKKEREEEMGGGRDC